MIGLDRRCDLVEHFNSHRQNPWHPSTLDGPPINPRFEQALDELIAICRQGHLPESEFFNPSDEWLFSRMRVFHDIPAADSQTLLAEWTQINKENQLAKSQPQAAARAGPDTVARLDTGGRAFFSQLGVARRPDLTQYFIDGFARNRDALAFSKENQALFAEVFTYITKRLRDAFASGDTAIQIDRQICDAPDRSILARQILYGERYLQLPYMWRQLTFDPVEGSQGNSPAIIELSIPHWLDDVGLPRNLKKRIKDAGLAQLVFKAPTKGLSLHLGFDYMGEHKMGPLSIAMFQVKQKNGLAIQAALSMARVKTLDGTMTNTALITAGPSLHGKSTLTIMIELDSSDLAKLLGLETDPAEGVYPMNDDIVLLQPMPHAVEVTRGGNKLKISYGIDGTENSFYAVPFGLTHGDDPITYEVLRGTSDQRNADETLENVAVNPETGTPDFGTNPTRNMRMVLSRSRLLKRKGVERLLEEITGGQMSNSAHVPMEHTDRVFWQAVMRQNTVVPPLRRLQMEQYVRVLMYGEAVQMGAATGTIGTPYVEYFSDPFIIGLEDENPNLMYYILQQMESGGSSAGILCVQYRRHRCRIQ